jgi:hypothetical protein
MLAIAVTGLLLCGFPSARAESRAEFQVVRVCPVADFCASNRTVSLPIHYATGKEKDGGLGVLLSFGIFLQRVFRQERGTVTREQSYAHTQWIGIGLFQALTDFFDLRGNLCGWSSGYKLHIANNVQGWRQSEILHSRIEQANSYWRTSFVSRLKNFNWPTESDPRSLSFSEMLPFIIQRRLGEIIGASSFANVSQQTQECTDLKNCRKPLKTIIYLLCGLLFFGWGWFRWKGLYNYPNGLIGYVFATIACIAGALLWFHGYTLTWSSTP